VEGTGAQIIATVHELIILEVFDGVGKGTAVILKSSLPYLSQFQVALWPALNGRRSERPFRNSTTSHEWLTGESVPAPYLTHAALRVKSTCMAQTETR
jgi:hypothetical protein